MKIAKVLVIVVVDKLNSPCKFLKQYSVLKFPLPPSKLNLLRQEKYDIIIL